VTAAPVAPHRCRPPLPRFAEAGRRGRAGLRDALSPRAS